MKFNTFAILLSIAFTGINANKDDCYLKYTGDLIVSNSEEKNVGIGSSNNLLGHVGDKTSSGDDTYHSTPFAFYECQIDGYHVDPEEHGFLIANGVNTDYCSTAMPINNVQNRAYVEHDRCDYNGASRSLINRQLVYANYYDPGQGPVIDLFFQGSPQIATNTGFNLRSTFFAGLGTEYASLGELILSNRTSTLHYNRLRLTNVVVEQSDSLVKGKQTRNEGRIANALKAGKNVNLSPTAQESFKNKGSIF